MSRVLKHQYLNWGGRGPGGPLVKAVLLAAPKALDPLDELFLELLSEDDVDEHVDRGVEGDQEVGGFGQRFELDVQHFEDVDYQGENVAEKLNLCLILIVQDRKKKLTSVQIEI